jgi:hypothetical protein
MVEGQLLAIDIEEDIDRHEALIIQVFRADPPDCGEDQGPAVLDAGILGQVELDLHNPLRVLGQQGRHPHETLRLPAGYGVVPSLGLVAFLFRETDKGIGLAKARLQHMATAAAINVYRISDRLGGVSRAAMRTSPFLRLVA